MGEMIKDQPTDESTRIGVRSSATHGSPDKSPLPGGETSGRAVVAEVREVASHVAGQAKELMTTQVTHTTERSAGDLGDVARALRQSTRQLDGNMAAPYVEKAADQLERVSTFLRTASPDEVVRGVESFARREPLLFLGGAFALGILGARFLKSSARRAEPAMADDHDDRNDRIRYTTRPDVGLPETSWLAGGVARLP